MDHQSSRGLQQFKNFVGINFNFTTVYLLLFLFTGLKKQEFSFTVIE